MMTLGSCLIELGKPGKQLANALNEYLASYAMAGLLDRLAELKGE